MKWIEIGQNPKEQQLFSGNRPLLMPSTWQDGEILFSDLSGYFKQSSLHQDCRGEGQWRDSGEKSLS